MKTFILFLASTLLISGSTIAATCVSLGSGDWNTPSTWSCGSVPTGGDDITIQAGHTVSISAVTNVIGPAVTISIDGILLFDTPGAKLKLPCGSVIIISASGSIQSSGTGQASHSIQICRNIVWSGSDGTLTGPIIIGIVLPIELNFFEAEANGSSIDFKWQTASENNNHYFTIEGSSDGYAWDEMHRINGAGTTQEVQDYSYKSDNTDNYTYFKLRQTDFDGKYTYSDLVAVQILADIMKIYPNPTNGAVLNIELPSKKSGILQIMKMDGQVAYSKELTGSSDVQLTDLNLKAGTYILQIQQNDQLLIERLVIQ